MDYFRVDKNQFKDSILSPTIIVGVVTLFAYLLFFRYTIAYFSYFNIPRDLIDFNIFKFFSNSYWVAGIAAIILGIVFTFQLFFDNYGFSKTAQSILIFLIVVTCISVITVIFYFNNNNNNSDYSIAFLIFSIIDIVFLLFVSYNLLLQPLIKYRHYRSLSNIISILDIHFWKKNKESAEFTLLIIPAIILLIIHLLTFSQSLGELAAINQTEFFVVQSDDSPKQIAFFITDDKVALAYYGEYSHIIDTTISIVNIDSIDKFDIKLTETGPLHPGDLFELQEDN